MKRPLASRQLRHDASMATDSPLVRIRNLASNKVEHCRTFNHYRSVATGNAIHSTQFTLPLVETGASELCVIANGIASASGSGVGGDQVFGYIPNAMV